MILDASGKPMTIVKAEQSSLMTLNSLVRSALASQIGSTHGGSRDVYNTLGYKEHLVYQDYLDMYNRSGFAKRVLEMHANDTWSNRIRLVENDEEDYTPFEQAWVDLNKRMNVFNAFRKADILAGFGRYSVLVMGLAGSGDVASPVARLGLFSRSGLDSILFLRSYRDEACRIDSWYQDMNRKEFGKPEKYQVDMNQLIYRQGGSAGDSVPDLGVKYVHESRTIHFSIDALENEVYGKPVLQSIYNRLVDIEKVLGASAEAFWINSSMKISLEADAGIDLSEAGMSGTGVAAALQAIKEDAESFYNNLQSFIRLQGMRANQLTAPIADPKGNLDALLSEIAAEKNIPKRKLMGSEQGSLASDMDNENYHEFLDNRFERECEPRLNQFVIKLIDWGILPKPVDFEFKSPDRTKTKPIERASAFASASQGVKSLYEAGIKVESEGMAQFFMELAEISGLSLEERSPEEMNPVNPIQTEPDREAIGSEVIDDTEIRE